MVRREDHQTSSLDLPTLQDTSKFVPVPQRIQKQKDLVQGATPQPTGLNYQNDEVMSQVRNDPESLDVLHSVMMGLAEEAAAMAQARVSLEAQGRTHQMSAKRVTALRAIGDMDETEGTVGRSSLDLEGVAFKRVFGFTMETFRKALSQAMIRPEQIEVIFAKLAKLMNDDWIKEVKKRADGESNVRFLSDIVMGAGRVKGTENRSVVDIITFIESEWGLKMRLFPVQKVILKAHYGIPLDDTEKTIPYSDWRRRMLRC